MIRVEDLTKHFGAVEAVRDISFEVGAGETFALLGPNGSGKTTALKCMVGLTLPTSGRVLVDGHDVRTSAREAKRLLSYLPQRVAFHGNLTAREVLEFYCSLRRLSPRRIDETLEAASLEFNGSADRRVGEFSGGMVQRLGLAVACLPDVPVLVLDEPTISLDPGGAIRFREFLGSLKRQGKTVVFSSHVLTDVERLADRVAILVDGKLVAVQSVEALRDELMRGSRMRVVVKNPSQEWLEAASRAGAEEVSLEGDALMLTARAEDRLDILRAIERAGGEVARFATEERSLEDIYLGYIREYGSDRR